ncbi:hypothetical protein [Kitasatospora griseola]|uniref:hypothetical protein n=1 Tax=Kitasatospora griseola TaxID=2064 RepID=UPI0038012DCA
MRFVDFSENSLGVTAHIRPSLPGGSLADITVPLAKRNVEYTIDFETGDHIEAWLPDGSHLVAGPTFDDDRDFETPGPQNGWYVGWLDPAADKNSVEPLYDSQPGYPDERHGTDVAPMLAALNEHLDRHGVPTERDVQDRRSRAESLLHRAGFVRVSTGLREAHHRLPSAMTDPAERRAAVTRTVSYLQAEGFPFVCPADLVDETVAPAAVPSRSIAQVGEAIARARHTSEVADALGELTAPGDGVLDEAIGVVRQTASWWEGLGRSVDPHYAARLRYIADRVDGYAQEVRAMRGDLVDRHTPHPGLSQLSAKSADAAPAAARVSAARATSPVSERTGAGQQAPAPAVPAPPASGRPGLSR